MKIFRSDFLQATLNSYSMVFFSQHNFLAFVLLLSTFFLPLAGFTGLFCVIVTLVFLKLTGHSAEKLKNGIYSFNALLLGLGFGSFYQFNTAFGVWILVALLVNALLTVVLFSKTEKYGLPVLSLPFIIAFWLILLCRNGFPEMGLLLRNVFLQQEIFIHNDTSQVIAPFYIDLFFRSLSAVIFQDSFGVGLLMGFGLFIHSRIAFSLLVSGFAAACMFNYFIPVFPAGISIYYLGANLMMVALATGSFFLIPSARSYLWAALSVIICFLMLISFSKILEIWHLPLFSFPFCVVGLLLIGFFKLRIRMEEPALTTLQHYSPETNLYLYLNHQKRLKNLHYLPLQLPFMGSWKVSQGYNGTITHQNDWAQALDFVVEQDGKTCQFAGAVPAHFYCYNKPVLAVADGVVAAVADYVEDNPIGGSNLLQNWGNSIVIKHADGLYSQVSHLKKGTAKVQPGDAVKQGAIIGYCGNSGRSPEPHLHFQLQALPFIGAKTLAYPFGFFEENPSTQTFKSFAVPAENSTVKTVPLNADLKQAFTFEPGFCAAITTESHTENWAVYTDALSQTYFYSQQTGAAAYFVNDGRSFYFTSFYGDQHTLLYSFFLAAYRVVFSAEVKANDTFPLSINHKPKRWLQDLAAPFYRFTRYNYQNSCLTTPGRITVFAKGSEHVFKRQKPFFEAEITVGAQKITGFNCRINQKNSSITWHATVC